MTDRPTISPDGMQNEWGGAGGIRKLYLFRAKPMAASRTSGHFGASRQEVVNPALGWGKPNGAGIGLRRRAVSPNG
jgi:hypothetical protein